MAVNSAARQTAGQLAPPRLRRWQGLMLVGIALALTGLTPATATAAACADLLHEKCQGCHALARTCDGLGRDQQSWQKSVATMATYAPTITAREQKKLVKCLAKQKKDVVELCRP